MKLVFFALIGLFFIFLIAFIFRQFNSAFSNNQTDLSLSHSRSLSLKITSIITFVLLAISMLGYLYLGSINKIDVKRTNEQNLHIEYSKVLANLAKRINQEPENPYSWYLLAQGYLKLNQLERAKNYINRAYDLDLADGKIDFGEILLTFAKVLASEKGDFKDETSFNFLNEAHGQLLIQNSHPDEFSDLQKEQIKNSLIEAKWLLGFAYFNQGQIEQALKMWQELDAFNLEPNQRAIMTEAVRQLNIYQANRFELKVLVNIEPSLVKKIESTATLFLVLRAGDLTHQSNMLSMPLAAKRIENLTFPSELTLTQDDLLVKTSELISREQKFNLQAFISQKSVANISSNDLVSEVIELNQLDNSVEMMIQKIFN